MAEHVPGPWAVCQEPANDQWRKGLTIGSANPSDARRICDLPELAHPETNDANGRLICAAPDLLDAAKLVLAWYEAENNHAGTTFWQRVEMCRESESAIRSAIAKAEGLTP